MPVSLILQGSAS